MIKDTIKTFLEKWESRMAVMDAYEMEHGRLPDEHETAHFTRREVQDMDYIIQEYKLAKRIGQTDEGGAA